MNAVVLNVRSEAWRIAVREGRAVYVGRPSPGFKGSPFGNPWKTGQTHVAIDGNMRALTRDDAIELYRQWARGERSHPKGKLFPHDLLETLRGKFLGCWCAPKACHADVLVELLNQKGEARR
jgi:hypothetical protein